MTASDTTQSLLDEATEALLAQMVESGAKPVHQCTPVEARAMSRARIALYGSGPDMAEVREVEIPSACGRPVRVRILVPHGPVNRVVLWYHGGGWMVGDIDGFDAFGRSLAERSRSVVALVDYHKAPENPFPDAVDDAWSAACWAAEVLVPGFGNVPFVVAGDSAGGNLAAVTCLRARDDGLTRIDQQVLVYPVTDHDFDNESYLDPANQLVVSRETMMWFWENYAPQEQRKHPDASPLRATNHSGLPPALIVTARYDPLCSEGEKYAAVLHDAGVPVVARRFDDQMHGFLTLVNILPGSSTGLDYICENLYSNSEQSQ